jgi:GBP family porin
LENFEMKKTLVAIAALAVVGAVSAQSTVTLYGKIDLAVASRSEKTAGVNTANSVGTEVNSSSQNGSRWGMKGSEDLGGGMKAVFQVESSISADTGASTGFTRQAYAGLTGGFGSVTAGRQYNPYDNMLSAYDPHGAAGSSALGYAFSAGGGGTGFGAAKGANGFHADSVRASNSIRYATPAMGGFSGEAMWAPGENKNSVTGQDAGRYYALRADYNNGPLGVGMVYESTKNTGVANTSDTNKAWALGAQYNLGVAKLYAIYESAKNSGNLATADGKDRGWGVGASIPVGASTLGVSYAREKNTAAGAAVDGEVKAFGAQLIYPLSKRTRLYTSYLNGKSSTAANVETKTTALNFGMQHDF